MGDVFLVLLLIAVSSILSYYETYFRTVSRVKMRRMFFGTDESESLSIQLELLDITIHIAVMILNIIIMIFLYDWLHPLNFTRNATILLTLAGAAMIIGVFNVLLPGLMVRKDRESFSSWEIGLLKLPYFILYPIASPIRHSFEAISRRRKGVLADGSIRAGDDAETLIHVGEAEGLFKEDEGKLLHSVVEFSETVVREVMTPRTDIICINIASGIAELHKKFIESGHSRIPVFNKTIDDVVGVVHVKDLIRSWDESMKFRAELTIDKLMKPPYFIPETKLTTQLLHEFQDEKLQIAIVVDEYGGVEGLVTLEDLLEELVGEIKDEYVQEPDELVVENEDSIIVNGRIAIEEVEDYFNVRFPEEDFDTIGGFIFQQLGRVPDEGDAVGFENLHLTVLKSDERRIHQVRITRIKEPNEPDEKE